LQLEAKILLGDIRGRVDHMAVDLKRQRLFVAELGNDSVGVVDLANLRVIRTIVGLNEPQGVGFEPSSDTLFVANARDGSVKLFEGNEYKATGRIELGSDADNVRIDASARRVVRTALAIQASAQAWPASSRSAGIGAQFISTRRLPSRAIIMAISSSAPLSKDRRHGRFAPLPRFSTRTSLERNRRFQAWSA
jgi:YVTN family beta-propeller protein